jgi:Zn-dependent protease
MAFLGYSGSSIGVWVFDRISIPTVLISYVALLFSLSVHEASHATAAYLLGDDTAQRQGRMTLNPIAHADIIGTVLFPIMGLLFGGFFIGWAKPVPFDPYHLTRRIRVKVSAALISFAGPASNLVMSILFLVITALSVRMMAPDIQGRIQLFNTLSRGPDALIQMGLGAGSVALLGLGGQLIGLNVLLAVFNLLPLGPLDGAGVLGGLIPDKYQYRYNKLRYHPGTWVALIILMVSGLIGFVLGPVMSLAFFLLNPVIRLILGA